MHISLSSPFVTRPTSVKAITPVSGTEAVSSLEPDGGLYRTDYIDSCQRREKRELDVGAHYEGIMPQDSMEAKDSRAPSTAEMFALMQQQMKDEREQMERQMNAPRRQQIEMPM